MRQLVAAGPHFPRHELLTGPHSVIAQVARSLLNKADNELSGVVSTAIPLPVFTLGPTR